jgi:hypothetical protein
MKKLLFILPVMFLFLAACKNKDSKKSVAGKWKPVEINIAGMSDEEKKTLIDSTIIEFSNDGKFTNNSKSQKLTGTYIYNEKDSTLTATNSSGEGGKAQKFTIGWEADKMLMTNEEGTVKLKKK